MKAAIFRSVWILLPAVLIATTVMGRENHRPYVNLKLPECAECHKEEGVPPNHGGGWKNEHRILASGLGNNCYECHEQSTCQNCHKGGGMDAKLSGSQWKRDIAPDSHRSNWISIHPIQAQTNPQNCSRCHEPKFCSDCHGRLKKSDLTIKSHRKTSTGQSYIASFPDEHAAEARRNLASCQSCHPDGDVCLACHSARTGLKINPHPANFKADRIRSRSNSRSCRVCHDF